MSQSAQAVVMEPTINSGAPAPNFDLFDQYGKVISLASVRLNGPVVLVFYPKDFGLICTKQLCSYRDCLESFAQLKIQILGLSSNTTDRHARFATTYDLPFPLLSDRDHTVARLYECESRWMLGNVSRAIVVINRSGMIVYRRVEPTILTWQNAESLVTTIDDLLVRNLLW